MTPKAGSVLVVLALAACVASAAEAPAPVDADKAFEAAATWRFGQDEAPLIAVGTLVSKAHGDAKATEEVEARLVKLLETATPDCKRVACRQLWMAGTPKAVPAVAKLLLEEDLADAARYAIERMADPAAGAALREAAGKAKGEVLVGIINSLGHRRDAESVKILLPLLAEKDDALAASAAGALGRIGTSDAATALTAARTKAEGKLRPVLDDACLTCADVLISASPVAPAAGPQRAAAVAIYQALYAADQPRRLRIAALRGLMIAQPDKAAATALEAMKGADARLAAVAAALLRELPGPEITQALADVLPKLPTEGQVMMLGVLAQRGGPAARAAAVAAAAGKDPLVRIAGLTALGYVGSAQDVPLLVEAAAEQGGAVAAVSVPAARLSLVRLAGKDVEEALLALLKKGAPAVKAEAIRALSARSAGTAVTAIVALAADEDNRVRAPAFAALGTMATEKEMPALLGLLVKAAAEQDRADAAKAVSATCARAKDKAACSAAVLTAMEGAPAAARALLLRVLPLVASDKALAAARAAMKDAHEPVRDAALRALSDWPSADGLDDLLAAAAAAGTDQTHKVLALRGCVRVLGQPSDRSPAKTAELFAKVLALAERPDDKKFVIAGLAGVGHADALKLLEPLMSDAAVKAEAQAAAIKVALMVAGSDSDLAKATVDKIVAAPANDGIKDSATAAATKLAQPQDYILAWMLSGSYSEKGKTGQEIFNTAFAPEKADAKDVKWRQIVANKPPVVDLAALIGGEQCAAYLRSTVISPAALAATLEVGSNDGVKVWLNGKLIHSNNAARALKLGEDKVKITLQAGENPLMVEVVNGATDWETAVRIVGADGKAIAGMKVVAK
jgi:HEAT repeat protein